MDLKNFPYTTSMACQSVTALDKDHNLIAKASIQSLKKMVPAFALKQEFDLLAVAFNSCVVNLGNLNGDLIDTKHAMDVYHKFMHRPINIEHNRGNIVGHLIGYALSSFDINYKNGEGSNLISEADVKNSLDPFNISLSGFIYKVVDPELVDLINEASNPLSDNYLKISASWEMAFTEFDILFGSPLMSKGEVITDPERKAELASYTKAFGGSGKYKDGQDVYRIIKGKIIPLGIGLTTTPAAAVQGVIPVDSSSEANLQNKDSEAEIINIIEEKPFEELAATIKIQNQEEFAKNKNNISQLENNVVNLHSIMRFKDINDENLKTISASKLQEIVSEEMVTVASHNKTLADAIEKASLEYGAKLDEQKKVLEEQEKKASDSKASLEDLAKEFEKVKAELEAEKTARQVEASKANLTSRLATLSETYNLNDKDKEIVAKQISGLSDEDYASWLTDWAVIAETKAKSYKAPEQTQASAQAILDELKSKQSSIANAQDLSTDKAKWDSAFKLEDLVSK